VDTSLKSIPQQKNRTHKQLLTIGRRAGPQPGFNRFSKKESSTSKFEGVSNEKTWLITGASRGFGALFVKEAFDRGDNVVATARNPQASQRNSVRVPTSLRSS
jgi:hypothetical protein